MRGGVLILALILSASLVAGCGPSGIPRSGITADSADLETAGANRQRYLQALREDLRQHWPHNRTINIVCDGHSVPAGYFRTPRVQSLQAWPNLLRIALAERYPYAVINVIVSGVGGDDAEQGARRFDEDVLAHRPDLVTLDYALNDRAIGLERARLAWVSMIEAAQARQVKLILMTPTPDLDARLDDPDDPLNQHAEQIRRLAARYDVGLIDSLALFKRAAAQGGMARLMAQHNHPDAAGHALVAETLLRWLE